MKKIVLFCAFAFVSLMAYTQAPVAVFSPNQKAFEVKGEQSVTRFNLQSTAEAMATIEADAAKYPGMVELSSTFVSAGLYSCVLTINGQPQAEYIHKMFTSFGIEEIQTSEGRKPLSDLVSVLQK